jgi:hypothetical protein
MIRLFGQLLTAAMPYAVEQLGEISPVPGSQILARTYMYTQRHADFPQTIIIFFKKVSHKNMHLNIEISKIRI